MEVIRFRVRRPDGKVEELVTEAPRVLVGCGSHCEIRLPIGAARVEHVLIQSTPAGLRAAARSLDPAPKLDGVEFTEAPIRGDCVLSIHETRIEISPSTLPGEGSGLPRTKGRANPRIVAYLVVGLACWALLYAARSRAKAAAPEPREVPSLWAAGPSLCPQSMPDQALATATERRSLAVAKQERSPFHPEDGVAAVPLYEAAQACFRLSGHDAEAAEAAAEADRLRLAMTEAFRVHRLRMKRALAGEEWTSAEREAGILLALLSYGGGEYASWLTDLRRRLQLRYGAKGKQT